MLLSPLQPELGMPRLVHEIKMQAKQLPASLKAQLELTGAAQAGPRPVVRVGMPAPNLVVKLMRGPTQCPFPFQPSELLGLMRLEVRFDLI